jgi:hypothetical protein
MVVGGSILSTGLQGIQKGLQLASKAADQVAKASAVGVGEVDLTGAAVDLAQAKLQVQASVMVAKRAEDMLGTLIDTNA